MFFLWIWFIFEGMGYDIRVIRFFKKVIYNKLVCLVLSYKVGLFNCG